ncbi:ATP-binding protein [Herbidospora mongoliensis]|uniref:ATP-binding protein n=1 Tax=Herbidospora mongoliensis TaxID=688067 RepID=UPI000A0535B2|nr:ATP-binding protein [Herbidospora mongoliensis]
MNGSGNVTTLDSIDTTITTDLRAARVARLAGGRDQIVLARRMVSATIGRDHPLHDDCVLLTSEIATNAVIHSRSGDGGVFTVTVWFSSEEVRVCVQDDGSTEPPCAGHSTATATNGRGLPLLDALADRWGIVREGGRNKVWFEMSLTTAPPSALALFLPRSA